jgi:hypothetical protein
MLQSSTKTRIVSYCSLSLIAKYMWQRYMIVCGGHKECERSQPEAGYASVLGCAYVAGGAETRSRAPHLIRFGDTRNFDWCVSEALRHD